MTPEVGKIRDIGSNIHKNDIGQPFLLHRFQSKALHSTGSQDRIRVVPKIQGRKGEMHPPERMSLPHVPVAGDIGFKGSKTPPSRSGGLCKDMTPEVGKIREIGSNIHKNDIGQPFLLHPSSLISSLPSP